jgi:hypothetical protein
MCWKRTMPSVEYEKDAGELPGDGFANCGGYRSGWLSGGWAIGCGTCGYAVAGVIGWWTWLGLRKLRLNLLSLG